MKKLMTLLLLVTFALQAVPLQAQESFEGVLSLINRRIPWLSGHITINSTDKENGHDIFILSSTAEKIQIKASSTSAASLALNLYLEKYCHRSLSHMDDNLSPLDKLPNIPVPDKQTISSPIRYALNYCTVNYTMSFYKWEEWEHELDWMALQGVNLMLAPIGVEKVWQNTLRKFGCSKQEITDFIPGPAFTAWWLMGNLEGWGGPVSQEFIDGQAELQKKILARMKDLGIEPVMQGFYGMFPSSQHKEPYQKDLLAQGKWAGGFNRPDILNPSSKLFEKVAAMYYKELKLLYGNSFKYFGGDLFHEGGDSGGLDISLCGKGVQDAMQKSFPESTWVLQGWGNNPQPAILSKVNREKMLVLDLKGENTDNWYRTQGYYGTPFVWCTVSNFGEQNSIFGKLQHIAGEIYRAQNCQYSDLMKGAGIMPEGINNNPVTYALVFRAATTNKLIDVEEWLKDYITYRYGHYDNKVYKAWMIFLQTAYASIPDKDKLPESVFCARPSLNITKTSTWGLRNRFYDMDLFKRGVQMLAEAEDSFQDSQTYQTDLTDFVRQVLADKGDKAYDRMVAAIKAKDKTRILSTSDEFMKLLMKQDSLLATNKHFRLSTWLEQAKAFGHNKTDADLAIKNAKLQISIWGPDWNKETDLHEYAAKEWSGMLNSLYYPRWKMFIEEQLSVAEGKPIKQPDYFSLEKSWAESLDIPSEPQLTDAQRRALIKQIIE